MACRCDGYYDEPRTPVIQGVSRKLYRKLLAEANDVTRFLCAAESLLTPEQLAKMPKDFKSWTLNHQEEDRKRDAKEKSKLETELKAQAKAKKAKILKLKRELNSLEKDS